LTGIGNPGAIKIVVQEVGPAALRNETDAGICGGHIARFLEPLKYQSEPSDGRSEDDT
jgi:hypothetical protein